jgi:hypothetical protein
MESKLVEVQRSTACCNSQNANPTILSLPPRIKGVGFIICNKIPLVLLGKGYFVLRIEKKNYNLKP